VKKGAEANQKSVEETQASQVKPTPTQEENDLAALGVVVDPKEEDGSAPEPELRMVRTTKQSEAGKPSGGTYATRSATPEPRKEPTHPSGSKPT
jgi:hypothetical protein